MFVIVRSEERVVLVVENAFFSRIFFWKDLSQFAQWSVTERKSPKTF